MAGVSLLLKAKMERQGLSPHQNLEASTDLLFHIEKENVWKLKLRFRYANDQLNVAIESVNLSLCPSETPPTNRRAGD